MVNLFPIETQLVKSRLAGYRLNRKEESIPDWCEHLSDGGWSMKLSPCLPLKLGTSSETKNDITWEFFPRGQTPTPAPQYGNAHVKNIVFYPEEFFFMMKIISGDCN